MRIMPKGSNPELFFKFNINGKRYRMYKATSFNKYPDAKVELGEIIDNNPNTWQQK